MRLALVVSGQDKKKENGLQILKLSRMKNTISVLILIVIFCGCKPRLKVHTEPCTRITTTALSIDSSKFKFFEDTFHMNFINQAENYLSGLTPRKKILIAYSLGIEGGNYLADPSITNSFKYIIVETSNNKYELIDTNEKFKRFFAPVDSKEEALSFACALSNSEPKYDFSDIKDNFILYQQEINVTNVKELSNGYEVQLFLYQMTGCPPHYYYSTKYFVGKNGDVKEIERKKFYEDPNDGGCRD